MIANLIVLGFILGGLIVKKTAAFVLVFLIFINVSTSVFALELIGDVWSLSGQKNIPQDALSIMCRGELTLIKIGPVRLMAEGQYAGDSSNIGEFISLVGKKLDEEAAADLGDFYLLGGLGGRGRVDWPIYERISVIGSVGYRVSGNVHKYTEGDSAQFISGLYGGITYAGGVGIELVRGLSLTGVYEYGPMFTNLIGESDNGTWNGLDIGVQYQIPLVMARAGYRWQELDLQNASGHTLNGFYISAGFHF